MKSEAGMLQPFEPLKPDYIGKLLEMKRFYLVSQRYRRYEDELFEGEARTSLLMTDYADLQEAKKHVQALDGDKYAALIDLQKPAHKNRVLELAGPRSRYHVFWAVVKSLQELEDRLNRHYKHHMRRYIETHTSWRISRDTMLRPRLRMRFGEIFIDVKYGNQVLSAKFEDIETT